MAPPHAFTCPATLGHRQPVSHPYELRYTKATVMPEYLPDGEQGARGHLAHVFLPKEIRFSVGAWRGIRELERGYGHWSQARH